VKEKIDVIYLIQMGYHRIDYERLSQNDEIGLSVFVYN
jgi:hypothetical protein